MGEAFHTVAPKEAKLLKRAMAFSLAASFVLLGIKTYALFLTHSSAVLSDVAESLVHVFVVAFTTYSLRLSLKPADEEHAYGHDRVSFFSAGFEGAMIIAAAVYILYESAHRWLDHVHVQEIEAGFGFIFLSIVINGVLGLYLVKVGKKHHSLVLEANGKHVLTDSWTSVGVLLALLLTWLTGWHAWDPIIAILIAINILFTGVQLIRRSVKGLMDEGDPKVQKKLEALLRTKSKALNIEFHGLRHRYTGNRWMVEFHLLFPDNMPIVEAHEKATLIEKAIHSAFEQPVDITSHLEPLEAHDSAH